MAIIARQRTQQQCESIAGQPALAADLKAVLMFTTGDQYDTDDECISTTFRGDLRKGCRGTAASASLPCPLWIA